MKIDEVLKLNDPKIIDIRNNVDYLNCHVPGSINISYQDLLFNYKYYLNKDDTYYIYCYKGITSKRLCFYLNSLGYKTISILGGYSSYQS